jgi:hypothetical protein
MKEITLLLCLKSLFLFVAIIYTIFIIDEIIRNILRYNKIPFESFEVMKKGIGIIPIKNSLITLLYWWIFYIASNL